MLITAIFFVLGSLNAQNRLGRPCVATMDLNYVCGSNGKTYDNASLARCDGVTSYVRGKCTYSVSTRHPKRVKNRKNNTKPPQPADCIVTREYDPVCSNDNRTFANPSEAKCAGVNIYSNGACEDKKPEPPVPCITTRDLRYVCGSDGNTYDNASVARCAGITKFMEGRCPIPTEGCMCPMVYNPVCGVNGKTYGNSCELGCAKVPMAKEGACEQSY